MTKIRNPKDLDKFLQAQAKAMCEFAANEVYEAINFFLRQYYTEWTPKVYQRTEQALNSAFKTTVKKIGNSFVAEVGIDYENLDYDETTGWQVISWMNESLHGSMDVGTDTKVWDDAIESTIISGQLLSDCIEFLKNRGIKIKA